MPQDVTRLTDDELRALYARQTPVRTAPPEGLEGLSDEALMALAEQNNVGAFQPERLPGDNGIYPTMRPNQAPVGTPQHEIDPAKATANAAAFGAQGTQLDPIDLGTLPVEDRAYLNAGMYVRLGNGEVRRMMADARPGAGGPGTQEVRPGLFIEENADLGTDIAKSLPTGVVEGLTGLYGAPGSLYNMLPEGARDVIAPEGNIGPLGFLNALPTGAQINEGIRDQIGYDYYQPQTVAGEYSRTLGEFLPGALAPGSALTRGASVVVPAFASETAGQIARGMNRGQRGTDAENYARMGTGLLAGLGVGGASALRGGGDVALRSAAEGVTPQQLQMAAALRQRGGLLGVDLTNAEALQQATRGGTGLGRLQRVVEGQTNRMAPFFAQRPGQVERAIGGELDRIGPSVEPSQLASQARTTANSVLERTRARINAEARPFYGAADQQVVSAEEYAALQELPTYRAAEELFYSSPELSAGAGGPQSIEAINRIIQQMDELARQADPGQMNAAGNRTLASTREQATGLAKGLVDMASPDYAQARAIGAAGRQNELAPIQRGPIGSIASQPELSPDLVATDARLFPAQPFEGQAAETARALELMGEIDPSVGGPLVRQHLARQAMEAQQQLATGDNQFGGANFAARAFGNPEQRRTVMGALDVVNRPDPNMAFPPLNANAPGARGSDPMANLVEVLQATGQRARAGSETAFNQEFQQQLRGGNVGSNVVRGGMNIPGIPGQLAKGFDDMIARRNAETLADLLMANSDEFSARLTRAINRPRGANRIRAGVTLSAGQED